MSGVRAIDHVTLRCTVAQLPAVQAFYERVVGLETGPRPAFDFPGAWLYAGDDPVLHLAAVLGEPLATEPVPASVRPVVSASTGYVDHFALRAGMALDAFRAQLVAKGVPFAEAPVPGWPLHQVFLVDPLGVKVELNFPLDDRARRG